VCSSKEKKQNVSVHCLKEWSDSNRAIYFIANEDIAADNELIVAAKRDNVKNK
jgi:hypothetical protein